MAIDNISRQKRGASTYRATQHRLLRSAAAPVMAAGPAVGGGGSAERQGRSGVARLRVKVRSSVYLIVVELERDGAILMQEVGTR